MYLGIESFYSWYKTPLGRSVEAVLLKNFSRYKSKPNENILLVGFAGEYINLWKSEHTFWGMPAQMGGVHWPENSPCQSLLLREQQLPFADSTFDKIILIHSLEYTADAKLVLQEYNRVLKPAGKLLAVVPNRLGGWVRREVSPFAQGFPYSRGQIKKLLAGSGFTCLGITGVLYLPPMQFLAKYASKFEKIGKIIAPAFSGLLLIEAKKDVFGGKVIRAKSRGRGVVPVLNPIGANLTSSNHSQKV